MAFPTLRRYLFRGAPYVDGFLNLTQRGALAKPLSGLRLDDIQECFSAKDVELKDMASHLVSQLDTDHEEYLSAIGDYAELLSAKAIAQQKQEFGLDTSTWRSEARRRVFTNNFSTPDAHAVVVVSLEPAINPDLIVKDPNLQRSAMGIFPGGSAAIDDQILAEMISGSRAMDGTPSNVIAERWLDIKRVNSQKYRNRESVIGTNLLGNNSAIYSLQQDIYPHSRGIIQSTLNMTSMLHSQHGVVPWTFYVHPEFEGIICMSLHLGSNPIPGGDIVNASIAPSLFKNIFRRTVLFQNHLEQIQKIVGEDALSEMLMNRDVVREFREILAHEDFALITDAAVLSALDATGGALLNELHLFTDTRVSDVDIRELIKTRKCEDFNRVGEEGERRAIAMGNLGETGFVKSKESDVVPDLGMLESGVVQDVNNVSKNWVDYPLPNVLSDLLKTKKTEIDKLCEKIDWDILRETAGTIIQDSALEILQGYEMREVVGNKSDKLATAMLDDSLKSKVASKLADGIEEQLLQDAGFQKFLQELDPDVKTAMEIAKQLFSIEAIAPRFQSPDMDPYFKQKLLAEVSSHKVVLLQNHESEVQAAITATETNISQTGQEKQASQEELTKVQDKLKLDPPDREALKIQEAQLQQQLSELAEEEESLKEQKETAEDMTEDEEKKKTEDAELSAEEHGKEAFEGK